MATVLPVIAGVNTLKVFLMKRTTTDIEIIDSGFADGVEVTFENGEGPVQTVSSVVFNPNTGNITATVTARGRGPEHRAGDLRVTNSDGSSGVFADCFTVTP